MKDILVLATGGREDEHRFAYAEQLAATSDAHFDVVLANALPTNGVIATFAAPFVAPMPASGDSAVRDTTLKAGAAREAAIKERFAARGPKTVVSRIDKIPSELGQAIADLARTRDTFICSLPGPEGEQELSAAFLDHVLTESGRSAIGLPQGFDGGYPIEVITIAWNQSRESARAVAEAMPLLRKAKSVIVLLVDQQRRAGEEARPGDDILLHLTHHGVKAKLIHVAKDELKTSDAILAEANRQGSQLLVIGTKENGGLLQWLQGTVSHDLSSKAQMPLFMAS